MHCERAQELFSDHCDGTIQPAQSVLLDSHLAACAACRDQLRALKEVWLTLDAAPVVEPPADFRAMVWQRIETSEQARRPSTWRPRFVFDWRALFTRPALGWAAAALLVAVLTGVVVPGRYTAARMMFPWNLFYRTPVAAWSVTAGEPRVEVSKGRVVLVVPLVTDTPEAIQIAVAARSDTVQVASLTPLVTLKRGQPTEAAIWMSSVAPNQTITLEMHRQGRFSEGRSLTITVPNGYTIGD